MPSLYNEIEERITKVLEDIDYSQRVYITKLAKKHHLPYQRLLARYNGLPSKCERPAANRRFTEE